VWQVGRYVSIQVAAIRGWRHFVHVIFLIGIIGRRVTAVR
jgi:hypothetical protein